jgi:hypothetical protein
MTPQIADAVGVKAVAARGFAALTVENSGNDGVRIMRGQPPHER